MSYTRRWKQAGHIVYRMGGFWAGEIVTAKYRKIFEFLATRAAFNSVKIPRRGFHLKFQI